MHVVARAVGLALALGAVGRKFVEIHPRGGIVIAQGVEPEVQQVVAVGGGVRQRSGPEGGFVRRFLRAEAPRTHVSRRGVARFEALVHPGRERIGKDVRPEAVRRIARQRIAASLQPSLPGGDALPEARERQFVEVQRSALEHFGGSRAQMCVAGAVVVVHALEPDQQQWFSVRIIVEYHGRAVGFVHQLHLRRDLSLRGAGKHGGGDGQPGLVAQRQRLLDGKSAAGDAVVVAAYVVVGHG